MSVEHLAVVLHHSRSKGTDKLVLLGIANHQGDGGAWPSIATLAAYANVDARSVQRSIGKLVSRGELRVAVQDGGTRDTADHRRPNRYDVLVSCPGYCDRTPNHRDTRRHAGPQIGLWRTTRSGVTPTSPVPVSGVTPTSPGGVTPTSPEPPLGTSYQQVGLSTTDRARATAVDERPCATCSQPEAVCQRRQAKLRAEDRHSYRAGGRG